MVVYVYAQLNITHLKTSIITHTVGTQKKKELYLLTKRYQEHKNEILINDCKSIEDYKKIQNPPDANNSNEIDYNNEMISFWGYHTWSVQTFNYDITETEVKLTQKNIFGHPGSMAFSEDGTAGVDPQHGYICDKYVGFPEFDLKTSTMNISTLYELGEEGIERKISEKTVATYEQKDDGTVILTYIQKAPVLPAEKTQILKIFKFDTETFTIF